MDDKVHFTIWMNNMEKQCTLSHPMDTNDWYDALTGESVVPEKGMMNITLDPFGYRILFRKLK
ncbi:hypothetical protein D3C77_719150 [compost metagenome]